jgi:hypothetical protein
MRLTLHIYLKISKSTDLEGPQWSKADGALLSVVSIQAVQPLSAKLRHSVERQSRTFPTN